MLQRRGGGGRRGIQIHKHLRGVCGILRARSTEERDSGPSYQPQESTEGQWHNVPRGASDGGRGWGSDAVRLRLTFESKAPAKNKNNCRSTPTARSPSSVPARKTRWRQDCPMRPAHLFPPILSPSQVISHIPSRHHAPAWRRQPTDEPWRTISPGRAECRHGGVTALPLARCHGPSHRARALLYPSGRTAAVEICKRLAAGDGALGLHPHPVNRSRGGIARPTGNRRLDRSAILSRRPPARFFASVGDCAVQPLV
ncbi:hypothetical protein B0T18DRAFT_117008 [Schizothecium vesticola]|uniref:Uncharacterized protein n=1 Tax=Schizothecium vesticola TaxID=314040 RepID=A0AA40F277_9PEZI|nr:hypothetical protein B0T18DRAFT_117008 [Schizothecium vesticola]